MNVGKFRCNLLCGMLGCAVISHFSKEALPYLDFRFIQQFNFYREDDFFENTINEEEKVNKLLDAIYQNPLISQEQKEQLIQIKNCMHQELIDYGDVYQRLITLKIKEKEEIKSASNGNVLYATYSETQNIITIYNSVNGIEKLPHEGIHIIFRNLTDYYYLNEGITELLRIEYCHNGIPSEYWENVYCIRILCEMISPSIILQAKNENQSK